MLDQTCVVRTDPDTQFRDALVTAAAELESVDAPAALGSGSARCRINGLVIEALENLAYEVQFYGSADGVTAAPATGKFLGRHAFAESDGLQNAATGVYRYFVGNLDIPYEDLDKGGQLHIVLVNRSVASKTAGDAGELRLDVWCRLVM